MNNCFFYIFLSLFVSCVGPLVNRGSITLDELNYAIEQAKEGDTIYIKPGQYSDFSIKINHSFDTPIFIHALIPGSVELTGNSRFTFVSSQNIELSGFLFNSIPIRSPIVIANSENIRINNNYFLKCGSSVKDPIIRIEDRSSNNLISHNTFEDPRAICIGLMALPNRNGDKEIENNIISKNYFYNIRSVKEVYPKSSGNGMEAIQLGQGNGESYLWKFHTVITDNLFENIVGDGSEIISNKTSNNVIRNNSFLNNKSGVTIRLGNGCIIENNYFNNTSQGVRVFGQGHKILNNYFFKGNIGISLPSSDFSFGTRMKVAGYFQPYDIHISNNYFMDMNIVAFQFGTGSRELQPENITLEYNKIFRSEGSADFRVIESKFEERIQFSNNQYLLNNDRISSLRIHSKFNSQFIENNISVEDIIGFDPYSSNDLSVGASWKRPF